MNTDTQVAKTIRTAQILVGAMVLGVVALTVIVLVVGEQVEAKPELGRVLFPILVLVAGVGVLMPPLVNRAILAGARQAAATAEAAGRDMLPVLLQRWMTRVVIGAVVNESLGTLAGITYLLTGVWPALLVAALAVVLLVGRMPHRGQFEEFSTAARGR